jgi:hypothetical protein
MNDEGIQSIITRKRIAIVIVALFLLVAAWFVFSITRSGWLEITAGSTVPKGTLVTAEIIRDENGSEPDKVTFKAGESKKIYMRKGTVRVNAEAGNIKSVEVVTVKGLSTTKITAPQGELRAIHKLGSNVSCPNVVNGQLYSFNCSGEGEAYRHNPVDSNTLDTRKLMFEGILLGSSSPLKNGALSVLTASEDTFINVLQFANFTNDQLERIPQTEEISRLLNDEFPNIVTSTDLEKTYFMLVFFRNNKAILYDSVTDTEPIELKLPKNATLSDNFGLTTFSFFEDSIVVYAGATDPTDVDEGPALTKEELSYENNIYEFDLSGNLIKTINLPKDLYSINTTKVTNQTYILGETVGQIFYHYDGKNFTKIFNLDDADEPLVMDDKAYLPVKGTLYEFTDKSGGQFSLRSVFSSPQLNVINLYKNEDGIIFTATAKRSESPVPMDAYQLLSNTQTTKPLEEVLDFEKLKGFVSQYDYDDTQVIFTLRNTGYGFDYETIRARMESKLKELGMDVGGRRVELYPLN